MNHGLTIICVGEYLFLMRLLGYIFLMPSTALVFLLISYLRLLLKSGIMLIKISE